MGRSKLFAVLFGVGFTLAAGCGKSPSSPSPVTGTTSAATESAVMSAMTLAMSRMALVGNAAGDAPNTFTVPCPNGGSIVITINPLPQQPPPQTGVFQSSSRILYQDCRNQAVTINGDPHLDTSMELQFSTPGGATGGGSVSTHRTIGGLRFISNGVQGRVQFNCTTTVTVTLVNGSTPQVSASSTGTTTFEQPIGGTPVVRPCGPA